jgi:hypothetical protein
LENTTPPWIVDLKAQRAKERAAGQLKRLDAHKRKMAEWQAEVFAGLPLNSPQVEAKERFAERLARDKD